MSFKKFSSAHGDPDTVALDDKSQNVPANDQPEAQPEKVPAEDAPESKS